jgi:hypothetical protein
MAEKGWLHRQLQNAKEAVDQLPDWMGGNKMSKKPRFILPPHPNAHMRIRRNDLPMYEGMNKYVAQRKFNGTHVVIWIYKNEVSLWDRRGIPLTLYKLSNDMKQCLLSLVRDSEKEMVVVGELLHTKAKSKVTGQQEATDTIVLFDVLMHNDNYQTISNQVDRLNLLAAICNYPTKLEGPKFAGATSRALIVKEQGTAHLWLAEVFTHEFQYHFDECCTDQFTKEGHDKYSEIEGLILRQKDTRLSIKNTGIGDVDWLIRCRKRKEKVYTF